MTTKRNYEDLYFWKEWNGVVPREAFPATPNELYVGSASYDGTQGVLTSTIYPSTGESVSSAFGKVYSTKDCVQILCYWLEPKWIPINTHTVEEVPENMHFIRGGREVSNPQYIGREYTDGKYYLGKVLLNHKDYKGLKYLDDNNKIITVQSFEILGYTSDVLL